MASIDPAVTPQTTDLSEAQRSLLESIKTGDGHVNRRRSGSWRRWSLGGVSAIIAVCAVILLVIVPILIRPAAAAAFTPPPLDYSEPTQTNEELLMMATTQLSRASGPPFAARAADYSGWYLQVDNLPDAKTRVAISPQVTTFAWNEDRSGALKVVAGEPYWADGSIGNVPPTAAPLPGDVLTDVTFAPGEFDIPSVQPPGVAAAEMIATLTDIGLPADYDAFTLVETTNRLMTFWTLTNEQHSVILNLLLQREDVKVLGETTDRAGREVIGVAAESTAGSGLRDTLLISTHTGRIVGMETSRTTPIDGIPAGAVVAYTVWKDTIG